MDEVARNHLIQQELDEDHPSRIFGRTVESDAIKRKREEAAICELDLQIAEKMGALKRRKIESIQFCYEALQSVGADDRDKLRATDMIRTVAFGSSSSSTAPAVANRLCRRFRDAVLVLEFDVLFKVWRMGPQGPSVAGKGQGHVAQSLE